jgi:hypothetical protein
MGIVINQATWGDETSATDITSSLQKQASKGYLDTVANNSLVPAINLLGTDDTVALTDSEKTNIEKDATKNCGGASDDKCIAFQKNQLESALIQKKVAEKQSSANIVTGRRLTLTYTDTSTGTQRTVAVPDGQAVKFGDAPAVKMPSLGGAALSGLSYAGYAIATILYVFSIAVTYRMMILSGHLTVAYILTGLAIVVPYSGLLSTPIALAIFKYMDAKKVVPSV